MRSQSCICLLRSFWLRHSYEGAMVQHELPRIIIREVDENAFRVFIDRCGEAVRVTEPQLRNLIAIAADTLFRDDPAIETVVAAAREEQGFLGELEIDRATAQAIARQMKIYRDVARLTPCFEVSGDHRGEQRQVAA
jgi:hypothetical protein